MKIRKIQDRSKTKLRRNQKLVCRLQEIQENPKRNESVQRFLIKEPKINLSFNSSTGNILGPGFYNYKISTLSGPSFKFPPLSRFNSQVHFFLNKKDNKKSNHQLQFNKDMKNFSKQAKLQKIKLRAELSLSQMNQIKKRKKEILQQTKKRKLSRLERKWKSFQLNQRAKQIQALKHSWGVLFCIFSLPKVLNYSKSNYYISQDIKNKNIQTLKYSSIIIGKVMKKAKQIRQKKRKIQIQFAPKYMSILFSKIEYKYRNVIVQILQTIAFQNLLKNLMGFFHMKIVFIQRHIRSLMNSKKTTLIIHRIMWNHNELKTMAIRNKKKKKKQRMKKASLGKGGTSIPDSIKDYFIKCHLRKRAKEYHAKIVRCQNPTKENYVITSQVFQKMIQEAMKRRLEWPSLSMY